MKYTLIVFILFINIPAGLYSQSLDWVRRYDGPSHYLDNASDVAFGWQQVFTAGSSWGVNTNTDLTVVGYDKISGQQQWVYRYNSPDSGSDYANSIVYTYGELFITGVASTVSSSSDIYTLCLSPEPTPVVMWSSQYTSPGGYVDQGIKIIPGPSQTIYVLGVLETESNAQDIVVLKYSYSGALLWTAQYQSPQNQFPRDISADILTGDVYVTGFTGDFNPEYIALKISNSGNVMWVKTYGGTANQTDVGTSCSFDSFSKKLYVTGYSENNGTGVGINTLCYSINGDLLWNYRYNSPLAGGTAEGYKIKSTYETIYVCGKSNETYMNQYKVLILGLDTLGNLKWKKSVASREGDFISSNTPTDMKTDLYGSAYISATGYDSASGIGADLMTIRINPNGQYTTTKYNSTPFDNSNAIDIADYQPWFAVTGTSDTNTHQTDFITALYFNPDFGKFRSAANTTIHPFSETADSIKCPVLRTPHDNISPLMQIKLTIDTVLFAQDGDLEFTLRHNNIVDTLIFHQGSSGDNFILTELSDSAATLLNNGTPPFTGSFKPEKVLSALNTSDPEGYWTLKVKNTGNSSGILKSWSIQFIIDENTIGIQPVKGNIPKSFSLSQNYPNPFNPSTNIKFTLSAAANVTLTLYDVTGREISKLIDKKLNAGAYNYNFDAGELSSGVYFYRLETGEFSETKKMALVK